MELDDRGLPLTRGQRAIWLAESAGRSGTEWQLGLMVRIEGTVERGPLEQAICQAVGEAEASRAAFFEVDGQIYQRVIEYPQVGLEFFDLSESCQPEQEARDKASSIQRTPMPLTGPLFRFALFRTQPDVYFMFGLCHHMALDGLSMALMCRRIATIYSATIFGQPVPPAYFGSLQDVVESEREYAASTDYVEDRAYWSRNLPPEGAADYRLPQTAAGGRGGYSPSGQVQMNSTVVDHVRELTKNLRIRRHSVITAACALLVGSWSANASEVALDFPVSRRIRPETKTLPGMFAGVVPLAVKTAPRSTIADFCRHVDARIRELLQHQRFPVDVLEGARDRGGARETAKRVAVNFIPSRLTVDLAGAPATATYTNHGPVGHFGLFFLGASEQLFLSTAGAGQPYANFEVSDLTGGEPGGGERGL